jgi:DNA-binding CsgD family transcriptional regulator
VKQDISVSKIAGSAELPCVNQFDERGKLGAMQNALVLQHDITAMSTPAIRHITERQKDCLRLVAQGYTSKEIGRQLDLSPSTVDNHILAATQALGASSRAEAARMLVHSEARQKMPSQPRPLTKPPVSSVFPVGAAKTDKADIGPRIFSLPPIGGQRNDLDATERTIRIAQVAILSFGTVMSLTLLIAGAFKLFS